MWYRDANRESWNTCGKLLRSMKSDFLDSCANYLNHRNIANCKVYMSIKRKSDGISYFLSSAAAARFRYKELER